MATAAEIQTMIDDLMAQQQKVATGTAVAEVWRDGRRMRFQVMSTEDFRAYLRELDERLREALIAEGATPVRRRRPIRLAYRN